MWSPREGYGQSLCGAELFFDRQEVRDPLAWMLPSTFHAYDRHCCVLSKCFYYRIVVVRVVIHTAGEGAHGQRIHVTAQYRHGFL